MNSDKEEFGAIGKFPIANLGISSYHGAMEQLCSEILEYAKANGLSAPTVVRYAVGANAQTWKKWQEGSASCSLDTAEKIRAFIRGDAPKYTPSSRVA